MVRCEEVVSVGRKGGGWYLKFLCGGPELTKFSIDPGHCGVIALLLSLILIFKLFENLSLLLEISHRLL